MVDKMNTNIIKPGNKIKIKSLEELKKLWPSEDFIHPDNELVRKMADLAGKYVTVDNVIRRSTSRYEEIYIKEAWPEFFVLNVEIERVVGNNIKLNDNLFEI